MIVSCARFTAKVLSIAEAVEKFPLPACVARIVHVPAAMNVTVVELVTVQNDVVVEVKATVSPDVDVAVMLIAVAP